LTAWGDSALTYDANGNLRTFNGASYNWDAREQLIGTSNGNGSFTYDPLGRRSSRTVAGDTTHYLYDGWNPLKVDDDVMLTGPALDEIYARISPTGITSFVRDDLGNTRLLTNASGATTAGYSYAPYGDSSKTGDDDTSFQFTGRENDGATKLDYYRERYYSTELERFISEDPIGLEGGINAYAYADGDPISLTDPMGLFTTVDAYCSRHGDDCLDILGEILGNLGHLSGDKCLEAQLNDTARIFSKVSKGVKLLKGIRPRGRRDGHHPYPKYLGGKEMQNLEKLKPHLHREYHRGLDRIAPRWLNRYYYEAYPADAKRRLHEEIREYTREFDRKHGTSILNSMFKNGFPRR
jgi:RHS repeat-associated protein